MDSTSPRWGEKASYYSAVCLETGEVEVMEVEGNSSAVTSVAFLQQLRAHHGEWFKVGAGASDQRLGRVSWRDL